MCMHAFLGCDRLAIYNVENDKILKAQIAQKLKHILKFSMMCKQRRDNYVKQERTSFDNMVNQGKVVLIP